MSTIEKAIDTLKSQSSPDAAGDRNVSQGQGSQQDTVQRAAAMQEPVAPDTRRDNVVPSNRRPVPASAGSGHKLINIPFDSLQQQGYLTPSIPRSAIADEYRTIKRPLLTNIAGHSATPIKNANLIMVTSALQGDGKTYTSINLALSIAMEQDKTVLFVDADVAKAEAGRVLGVPANSLGLIDVLENKGIGVEDVILNTNIEKLRILPAGTVHVHSNELLASDAMRRLMVELSERYTDRVVVFDSPPLLLTTEAGVLANLMGQIVFVVGAEVTPENAVKQAMEHIGQEKTVGVVLNRARRHSKMFSYGYGYGYGRGYGYGYGNRDRQPVSAE